MSDLRRWTAVLAATCALTASGCGPGGAPTQGPNPAYGCPGQRLVRVTNDSDATIEVLLYEGSIGRQIGTVVGRGSSTFQVPNRRGAGVRLRPYDRVLTRYEYLCG